MLAVAHFSKVTSSLTRIPAIPARLYYHLISWIRFYYPVYHVEFL
ncbi:hypothetical protein VP468E531_P0067 [Vibrio phage 468E53-1]|nr:hypothetical protein VP468E531_P0067 [Vibrio phage 468E53-1]CAH9016201.1 hypothetical protein VP177E371_P0066 [Vibrio phage 177E37-1]